MRSIASYSENHDNNYNLLRLIAASLVLFYHCYPLCLGKDAPDPLGAWIGNSLGYVGVFIFFVISGFLVTKSFFSRKSVLSFAEARLLRIFPPLAVAILFCTLIVGPIFTAAPLEEYAGNQQVYSFWLHNTFLYDIQYFLPGVFPRNPYPGVVNGSLWTMPYEIKMYCVVAVLGGLTLLDRRYFFNGLYFAFVLAQLFAPREWMLHDMNLRTFAFAFSSGMFLYVNRESIPLNGFIALAFWCLPVFFRGSKAYPFLFQVALIYTVPWFAYVPGGWVRSFNRMGDYSYGVYIYAFPIQQSVAALGGSMNPLQMFPVALVATLAVAVLSWHLIEKPALQSKGRFAGKLREVLRWPANAVGDGGTREKAVRTPHRK